ncbi:MAG: hypothetical protein Q8N23_18375 [Archangium sp.]|nr:hypothetical protein [Archangium sp.]MDP3572721.1 hypothetical protein [Archangium sp.]
MTIKGVEGLTVGDVQEQVRQGAKFVVFGYCVSFLIMTLRRSSDVTFIRAGQSAFAAGLPYTLLSFFVGWWGFPWGLIYTPMVLIQNLGGGTDVTSQIMASFGAGEPPQGLPPVQVR